MICKKCGSETDIFSGFCKICGEPNTPDANDINNDLEKHKNGFFRIFGLILIIMLAMAGTVVYLSEKGGMINKDESKEVVGVNKVRQSYIEEVVVQTKKDMEIPSRLDEITTIVDITAEPNSIRYHYILDNSTTTEALSNSYLDAYLKNSVCNDELIRTELIDQNIDIEYSYIVQGSDTKYFFKYTKKDCE